MSKTEQYPVNALRFNAKIERAFQDDNGVPNSTVRLVARSAKPIDHPFWGNIVHDNAGAFYGDSIVIDYCHDEKEIIGFASSDNIGLNEQNDLVINAELTPFTEDDRATEVQAKAALGVPYEASINFAGEGVKIERLGPGEVADVNGYEFEGPGVIVREWPLRGVAICPYGADQNTSSEFKDSDLLTLTVVSKEADDMPQDDKLTAAQDDDALTDPPVEETVEETVEAEPVVEPAPETETEAAPEVAVAPEQAELSEGRKEAKQFMDAFGETAGVRYFALGLSFEAASQECIRELTEERDRLSAENAHLRQSDSTAVSAPSVQSTEKPKSRFNFVHN